MRQYLQGKGVASGDIGYDKPSGQVTIRGQNFYKPELNAAGTTFSNQQNLENAFKTYAAQRPVIQPQQGNAIPGALAGATAGIKSTGIPKTTNVTSLPTTPPGSPYASQYEDIMKRLDESNKDLQQPVDIYNSPEYAAAKAQQDKAATQSTRRAQESMGASGFGRSTNLQDRAQGIQNEANDYLQTQLVPQIQNALQNKNQQQYNNLLSQFNTIYQLVNQAQSQSNADRTFEAGRQDAATVATGIYNPSGLSYQDVQSQMDKNSAAYATATPEEQQRIHAENIALGQQLGKTYEPQTGTYSQGQGFVGTKTLTAKKVEQELETGKMSNEAAEYNLKQLKDPNSATNKAKAYDAEIKRLELAALPEMQRQELEKIKKTISDIGVTHYKPQTDAEKQYDEQQVVKIKAEIDKIKNVTDKTDYNKDIDRIAKLYVTEGQYGAAPKVNNPTAMRSAIIALNMDDSETDRYLTMYGLPIN